MISSVMNIRLAEMHHDVLPCQDSATATSDRRSVTHHGKILRHPQATLFDRAAGETNDAVAHVDHYGVLNCVSAHACNIRNERIRVEHSHLDFPQPHEAKEHLTTTVHNWTQNFRIPRKIRFRAAVQPLVSCSVSGTPVEILRRRVAASSPTFHFVRWMKQPAEQESAA